MMNSVETRILKLAKRNDFKGLQEIFDNYKANKAKSNNRFNKNNININCREPKFQMTPLMISCLKGSIETVIYLIDKGANVDLKDIKGNTALQLACVKQKFHIIDELLKRKANQNVLNTNGWNCIISAVNHFNDEDSMMLLLLLQTGANTEQKDNLGLSCIDYAVRKNKLNSIRVILNYNPKLSYFCTRALINSAIKANFDMTMLFLNFGVNPNKIDETNGSSALHEAIRINDSNEAKNRQRIKIIKFLCLYGASPDLRNHRKETPMELAMGKSDKKLAQIYIETMKRNFLQNHIKPKYINITNLQMIFPNYPLLKPQINWTKNDPKFYSGYKPGNNHENVKNLIDGDPHSVCSFPGKSFNWAVFDLRSEHIITKIRIYAWKSKEMPKECYLQVSNSLEGPWNSVQTFICEMIGSSIRTNAGIPLDFNGFMIKSRYWRLVLANNFGEKITSFHGIEFFGFDSRISKFLSELNLSEYEDTLIENDLNQIDSIVNCTFDQFDELPIYDKLDRQKLWDFIVDLQKKAQAMKQLEWFNEPINFGLVGKILPPFSIYSDSFFIDSLQLISHGGGIVNGELCIEMEPIQINNQTGSIGIFKNIFFSNAGKFIIEAKCTTNQNVYISSQPIQIFELNDPEYYKLLNAQISKPSQKQVNGKDLKPNGPMFQRSNESEDESITEEQIDEEYNFPDFSSFDSKIKSWINKIDGNQKSENLLNQVEYETQSMTLDLSDESSIFEFDNNLLKSNYLSRFNDSIKTEAKAIVNLESNHKQKVKDSIRSEVKNTVINNNNNNIINNINGANINHIDKNNINNNNNNNIIITKNNDSTRNFKSKNDVSLLFNNETNINTTIDNRVPENPTTKPLTNIPPPPPSISQLKLEQGLLKFQKKNEKEVVKENEFDLELKQKLAKFKNKFDTSQSNESGQDGKFSIRAKQALNKYKNLN